MRHRSTSQNLSFSLPMKVPVGSLTETTTALVRSQATATRQLLSGGPHPLPLPGNGGGAAGEPPRTTQIGE